MTRQQEFLEACDVLLRMGVVGFCVTPELFVALARHWRECHFDVIGGAYDDDDAPFPYNADDIIECGRHPLYKSVPFKLAKEFK